MRKFILLALLLTISVNAQMLQKIGEEFTTITIAVDPYASYKENGINIVGEFTLVSYFGYIKAGIELFPGLEGGYFSVFGGAGFNQKSTLVIDFLGIDSDVRLYEGIHLGFNHRNATEKYGSSYSGPLAGINIGTEMSLWEGTYIGLRATLDWREDFKYSGAEPEAQFNGFVTFSKRL